MKRFMLGLLLIVAAGSAYASVGQAQTNSQAALQSGGEAVIDMLVERNFEGVASQVNSEFTGTLSAAKLRDGWGPFIAQVGSFRRRTGTTVGKGAGGYDEVTVTCEFEKAVVPARVLFDSEMKIVGLWINVKNQNNPAPALSSSNQEDPKASVAKAMAKEVVDIIVAEDFSGLRAKFNAQMKAGLSEQKLRELWASVLQNVGSFRRQVSSQYANMEGFDVVLVRCEFERGYVQIRVAFDSEKKIGGLYLLPAE